MRDSLNWLKTDIFHLGEIQEIPGSPESPGQLEIDPQLFFSCFLLIENLKLPFLGIVMDSAHF